jgi:hypothetical protein
MTEMRSQNTFVMERKTLTFPDGSHEETLLLAPVTYDHLGRTTILWNLSIESEDIDDFIVAHPNMDRIFEVRPAVTDPVQVRLCWEKKLGWRNDFSPPDYGWRYCELGKLI